MGTHGSGWRNRDADEGPAAVSVRNAFGRAPQRARRRVLHQLEVAGPVFFLRPGVKRSQENDAVGKRFRLGREGRIVGEEDDEMSKEKGKGVGS